jgi:hypothetical protein
MLGSILTEDKKKAEVVRLKAEGLRSFDFEPSSTEPCTEFRSISLNGKLEKTFSPQPSALSLQRAKPNEQCTRDAGKSNRDKIASFLRDNYPNFFSINQLSQELKISNPSVSSHCYNLVRFSPAFFEVKLFRLIPNHRKQACFRSLITN